MCAVEKKLMSCQLTYFPLQSENYLAEIDQVLDIIKSYDVEYDIGILSTTIRGTDDIIFALIRDIYDKMSNYHFTLNIMISNTCGCTF